MFVPDFVETFTVLPTVWPSEASNAAVCTLNSLMAVCGGENATRGRRAVGEGIRYTVDRELVLVVATAVR